MASHMYCRLHWPEDFWKRFEKSDGCWLWVATKPGTNGYPRFLYRGYRWRTHRLAYTLSHGPIPDGWDVCHTCDIRRCGRPEHLFLGLDKSDNSLDMWEKGRARPQTHYPDGRGHRAVLTIDEVLDIRRRYDAGEPRTAIAADYPHVTRYTVYDVMYRKHWKHLT